MTDSDLVRVLAAQTPHPVDLLPLDVVRRGPDAVRDHLDRLRAAGVVHVIADAVADEDLATVAEAARDAPLLAGGAAFGAAWAGALARSAPSTPDADPPVPPDGHCAVLVGSASTASTRQVASFAAGRPVRRVSVPELASGTGIVDDLLDWARTRLPEGPVLIATDSDPDAVRAAQATFGREASAAVVENAMGRLAVGLFGLGVRRLVVAGGETSGAVAEALGVRRLRIGPEICPGVPWTVSTDPDLALAFKSGNFGADTFFDDAFALLGTGAWTRSERPA